jgi:HPt (histidine-containing phosphotransfer) domain-containing protein
MSKLIISVDPDLADLVPGYFENRKLELQSLKHFFQQQKWMEIQMIGHKLKGNAASYGFEKLTDLGASLEESSKSKNQEKIHQLILEIESYLMSIELKLP